MNLPARKLEQEDREKDLIIIKPLERKQPPYYVSRIARTGARSPHMKNGVPIRRPRRSVLRQELRGYLLYQ